MAKLYSRLIKSNALRAYEGFLNLSLNGKIPNQALNLFLR